MSTSQPQLARIESKRRGLVVSEKTLLPAGRGLIGIACSRRRLRPRAALPSRRCCCRSNSRARRSISRRRHRRQSASPPTADVLRSPFEVVVIAQIAALQRSHFAARSWPRSRLSNVTGRYPAHDNALQAWLPTKPAPRRPSSSSTDATFGSGADRAERFSRDGLKLLSGANVLGGLPNFQPDFSLAIGQYRAGQTVRQKPRR
jgi:hypothetical protein